MYALIGDLVASRRLADRPATHRRLVEALTTVDRAEPGLQRLEVTVGDEFQGAYPDPDAAARVALMVRLALLPQADVRVGIGEGEASVLDDSRRPPVQDGPAWWAAREALEVMSGPRRRALRTWFVGADSHTVNARLLCRDSLVDRLNDRSRRMLAMALAGRSQQEIATAEGVSKSAVSQAFARGVGALRDAEELLRERR